MAKILTLDSKRKGQLMRFVVFRTNEMRGIISANTGRGNTFSGVKKEAYEVYKGSGVSQTKAILDKIYNGDFAKASNATVETFTPAAGSAWVTPKGNTVVYLWGNDVLTSSGKKYSKMPKQLSKGYKLATASEIDAFFASLSKKGKKNEKGNIVLPKVLPSLTSMRVRAM